MFFTHKIVSNPLVNYSCDYLLKNFISSTSIKTSHKKVFQMKTSACRDGVHAALSKYGVSLKQYQASSEEIGD